MEKREEVSRRATDGISTTRRVDSSTRLYVTRKSGTCVVRPFQPAQRPTAPSASGAHNVTLRSPLTRAHLLRSDRLAQIRIYEGVRNPRVRDRKYPILIPNCFRAFQLRRRAAGPLTIFARRCALSRVPRLAFP